MRSACALMILALLAVALVACSSEPETTAENAAGGATEDQVLETFDESLGDMDETDPYGELSSLDQDLAFE